jgi:recombination protein RecA
MVKNSTVDDITAALDILGGSGTLASKRRQLEFIPVDNEDFNNLILGCGGLPRGRIIELYAKTSVGKSTLAYWFIGQVQKRGGIGALFDAEGAYLPDYGASCGIDNDKLLLPEFGLGEDAIYKLKLLLASNTCDIIVIDSMPALQPLLSSQMLGAESLKMNQRLERAKMFTILFNDLMGGFQVKHPQKGKGLVQTEEGETVHKIYDKKTCLIFINHAKDKIGVMFGERTYTPGGDAINFASSIRIGMNYMKKSKKKDEGGQPIFKVIRVKAPKNKLAPPLCETDIKLYRDGRVEPLDEEKEEYMEEVKSDYSK